MEKRYMKKNLKLVVAFAVVVAMILPVTAANGHTETSDTSVRTYVKSATPMVFNQEQTRDTDIALTMVGDDRMPTITSDGAGHSVVTWTNEEEVLIWNMGIAYSDDPMNPSSWTGWAIQLTDTTMIFSSDTAYVNRLEPTDYDGLYGVNLYYDVEGSGYYKIPDITTDPSVWEFYTWSGDAPQPEYACVSNMGYYQDKNYPEMWGPFNFYIYREIYASYDITSCPICFHNDLRGGTGGVGYFDAQSFEKTAPASDPDIADLGDRFHTCVQYTNTTTGPHIVWKKVVPAEEPDYEFTPYQDTIADGSNPNIAAYIDGSAAHVAIVYMYDGYVKCIYSADDGETWATPVDIDAGSYPAICAVGTELYCCYINTGNLYKVTSTDGGATWSTPEQINDESGSVVAEENAVDIDVAGIVWIDNRGSDLDIYYETLGVEPPEAPKLEIGDIAGGFGIKTSVKNTGDAAATNVVWTITLDGKLVFLGKETTDTIATLGVAGDEPIKSSLILGIGKTNIVVSASCDEGKSASKSASGFVLGPFVLGVA